MAERVERDIEMRKIGDEEEEGGEGEVGGYGRREGRRDSGVGNVLGSVSEVGVVREVEVVEGREGEGDVSPVEGKAEKVRTSWWVR